MQRAPLLFVGRPLFAEVLARARDLIHCTSNDDEVKVEGVLHYGKSGLTYHRRLLPIARQDDWEHYVNGVMKNEIPLIDLLVRKLSTDSSPHMHSPPGNNPPIANHSGNVQDSVVVPDAESGPNLDGISHDPATQCHNHDVVTVAQEIPLSQNHLRDIPYNVAVPLV
ncbi:hypothetical protein PVAP13_8KG134201, partial [Panicum virgatum]